MHQAKKGNAWHFGMKAHIGADADSGLEHNVHATAANEADVAHVHEVLHGQETAVFADAGYTGAPKREDIVKAVAAGKLRADIDWHVAQRRSVIEKMADGAAKDIRRALERVKAQVRARRASVPRGQEPVSPSQGALQGAGKERRAVVQPVRVGQPRDRQAQAHGLEP